ncbi:MAG: phosphatase PAP2 family protein [Ignavibacteriae bacterium]|nr:phosphatase PAP2 family protein [Ignavibacteriota bacterium]
MKIYFNQIRRTIILVFLLQISFVSNSVAQHNYDIKQFGSEFGTFAVQPTNWSSNEWLMALGIASLTYGTMQFDEQIKYEFQANQNYRSSFPMQFGKLWGEPIVTLGLGASVFGYGLLKDDNTSKKIGYEIGQSAFFAGIITTIIKYGFGRERPRTNNNPYSFKPFSFSSDNYLALSSGHTALAFSLSTVLAENTDNTYLKVISFIPAVLTAFSRVYQNHHWTSDVLLGGIIGYSVGKFVTDLHLDLQVNSTLLGASPIESNIFVIRIPI